MAKGDLPREVRGEPLEFSRLVSVLDMIEGEAVIVRISSRGAESSGAGLASIVGTLRHEMPSRYEDHEFAVGSPYPDRYPEHLAGGVFFVSEKDFESAVLSTFDGNDYFSIGIDTRLVNILVNDLDSTAP